VTGAPAPSEPPRALLYAVYIALTIILIAVLIIVGVYA
jgi:hypothetical protein